MTDKPDLAAMRRDYTLAALDESQVACIYIQCSRIMRSCNKNMMHCKPRNSVIVNWLNN